MPTNHFRMIIMCTSTTGSLTEVNQLTQHSGSLAHTLLVIRKPPGNHAGSSLCAGPLLLRSCLWEPHRKTDIEALHSLPG